MDIPVIVKKYIEKIFFRSGGIIKCESKFHTHKGWWNLFLYLLEPEALLIDWEKRKGEPKEKHVVITSFTEKVSLFSTDNCFTLSAARLGLDFLPDFT